MGAQHAGGDLSAVRPAGTSVAFTEWSQGYSNFDFWLTSKWRGEKIKQCCKPVGRIRKKLYIYMYIHNHYNISVWQGLFLTFFRFEHLRTSHISVAAVLAISDRGGIG